ncbi:heterogeneous nuclear ribonucleoprotein L-like isoform X3 [Daktulosphaira vitifoliae]|uniref:heterogeneous nuclear ribonucleoprotein L-like isoform X3 n=1 Tax=Daktulosphaira vitifoliae TaxID=58002 RepID=UPI0021AAFB13|nr:heterogeneous nuclear ribonucleoprotein L-like isoform X3 [Daktulosphaira vitifoliae]
MSWNNSWTTWISNHSSKYLKDNKIHLKWNNRIKHYKNLKHKKVIDRPNRVIFLNISKLEIKMTTHVLYSIFCRFGQVYRIVIFHKFGELKAFVEFAKEDYSIEANNMASGFYYGCCYLKLEFAKVSHLTVLNNNVYTWDYETSPLLDIKKKSMSDEWNIIQLKSSDELDITTFQDLSKDVMDCSTLVLTTPTMLYESFEKEMNGDVQINQSNCGLENTAISVKQKLFLLYIYGLDPSKSNCDHVYRMISLYAYVARVRYFQSKLDCALVEIGSIQNIDSFALLQNIKLSHGKYLSFQFSKNYRIIEKKDTLCFKLSDGSPSFVDYTNRINHNFFSSSFPSKVVEFNNAPLDLKIDTLIQLLKKYLGQNKKFKIKLGTLKSTEPKKQISTKGLIIFEEIADAIEAIMNINYCTLCIKDTNCKYTLKLTFSFEEE